MHDAQFVTVLHRLDDGTNRLGRVLLTVLALLDDAIEQFTPGQQFHDDVHMLASFVRTDELDNVLVSGEMMKNSHLISHLFDILGILELALGDGFARALLPGRLFRHQERRPELTSSEFIVELKQIVHIRRLTSQHARRSRLFVTQRIRFPASLIHFLVLRDEQRPRARARRTYKIVSHHPTRAHRVSRLPRSFTRASAPR